MNILNVFPAIYYQLAFGLGLTISGVEEGRPQFIGNRLNDFWKVLELKNL